VNRIAERSVRHLSALLDDGISFVVRQPRDWKVTVLRTSLDKLAYQMVFPYLSIYIVALGATGTQLGLVNSIGMIIAGFCGPFTGWVIDRIGPKTIYLIGIGFTAASYLTFGLARGWEITIIAMVPIGWVLPPASTVARLYAATAWSTGIEPPGC
jgi:MFS family permease